MKQNKVWYQTTFLKLLDELASADSCPPKPAKSSQTPQPKPVNTKKAPSSASASSKSLLIASDMNGPTSSCTVIIAVNELNRAIGEDHIRAKYTNEEVDAVLRLRDEGYSLAKIARMTEIPIRTIRGYIDGSRRCQQPAAWRVKRI